MNNESLIETLSSEALTYPAKAKEIKVRDQVSLDAANAFLRGIKGLLAKIAETFDLIVKKAHEAHRQAIEQKKKHEEPLVRAEVIIKAEILRYLTEQVRIRREAVEEAQREADAKEKARLQKMQAAIDAENAGTPEEAEKHFEEAIAIEPPKPIIPPAVKAQGTSIRKIWRWRVVDPAVIPREFLVIDERKIAAEVGRLAGETRIPGVEVYQQEIVITRI